MTDLKNTIAHILAHKQHLAEANEATIQQYVVLPILRMLGWNDTNLASMEIIPEYQVESRRADYALHIKQDQNPVVLIECKRWNQPIGKNEEQICFYAYSGNVPLAIITNGKLWRFYLSRWEASSLSDRIFCETDIEDRENAIVDLEKYLLKSNVGSGEAGLNAEIALEEKGKRNAPEINLILPNPNPVDDAPDNPS
jgi:predicted type IV restriction endonuclease